MSLYIYVQFYSFRFSASPHQQLESADGTLLLNRQQSNPSILDI